MYNVHFQAYNLQFAHAFVFTLLKNWEEKQKNKKNLCAMKIKKILLTEEIT